MNYSTHKNSHLVKEDHYKELREQKRLRTEERRKANAERVFQEGVPRTNYTGHFSFLNRLDESSFRRTYQSRVLTSILTNEPSVVFDFQFVHKHTRLERIKSLYRQFIEIVGVNRESERPFQIHCCNYDYESEFNKTYNKFLGFDTNLIMETPKSYLDVFDREKLVYLSADSRHKMTYYDPDKVYIIGAMIDMGPNDFEYHSYGQAKKDGIACQRLPLELLTK